jgi:hypothetical protein
VKKLKSAKIRLRKSLIANGGILYFGAFCQFFHSFSVMAGGKGREGAPRRPDAAARRPYQP